MALDQAGAKNSAWMAAQILALHDFDLAKRIAQTRDEIALEVEKSNQGLF
jgi:5-(carboxyamino)imidazole ribonucleotide mutase